jgi:ABC-type multidrug transport system fused ATPase/permease subunit
MIELDSGRISIDGVDISTVPLSVLRKALAVIPQSPFIFTASVRYNLDPYGYYTDEEIWASLQTAHLHTKILTLEGKLDANLNGKSFSAGEKQLLCLARALLKKSQILVMDEATANVDYETDLHIQNAIKNHFSLCTVITIAHRLDTVIRSNVVMVIDNGCCVEIGAPGHLLKDNGSRFFAMVENSGEQTLKTLQKTALAQDVGMGKLANS